MTALLHQVAIDAQANCTQFADWLKNNNLRVGVFQIGPYQVSEAANATVGLTTELLERKGYKVDVGVNILTASAHPTAPKVLVLTALAVLVVRAPAVIAPDTPRGAPFEP